VQGLELILLALGVLLVVAYIGARSARDGNAEHPIGRLLLGIVPAAVAVSLVIAERFDVVPDDLEGTIWAVGIVLISGALILATSYRLARH
jgi:hypothetical protein